MCSDREAGGSTGGCRQDGGKGIIFLAFANDRVEGVRYLRNLPEEVRSLRVCLKQAQQTGLTPPTLKTR